MMQNVRNFLRAAFPFLLTVALWRLTLAIWNPAGILALIPIFFCTFVRPVPWFAPCGLLFCFLIDYNLGTPYIWTALWCVFYALNGFQTAFDLTRMEFDALYAFLVFLSTGVLVLLILNFAWGAFARALFALLWSGALYIPICTLIKRIGDD